MGLHQHPALDDPPTWYSNPISVLKRVIINTIFLDSDGFRANNDHGSIDYQKLAMAKVLIVDDHIVVRRGIVQILAESISGLMVRDVGDPAAALRLVWDETWDLLVLDVGLGGRSGLDLLSEIRGFRAKLPILVLTMYGEQQFAVRAIKAGADGYLLKSSSPEVLVDAVRKVLGGGKYISATLAERLAKPSEPSVLLEVVRGVLDAPS